MSNVTTEPRDAVTFLMDEHAAVELLFVEYQTLVGAGVSDVARARSLVEQMIHDLRLHAAMEEQSFYPSVRRMLADGDELVDEGLQEHQEAKEELAALEAASAENPGFDAMVQKLIADVRHHVNEEETEVLPKLRQAVGESWLVELGNELERTKARLAVQEPPAGTAPARPRAAVLTPEGPPSARRAGARKKSTAKKSTAKKSTAKKSTAKKSTAKRSTAKRSTAKKSTAKKSTAKKSTAKKSTASRAAAGRVRYDVMPTGDGRWQVRKKGAARPSSTHDRKSEAVTRGRALASRQRLGQLVVRGADGRIQSESTYGADPRRTRG